MRVRSAACVDVGSTTTKAALVDLDGGELLAAVEHPTTSGTGEALDGVDACLRLLGAGGDVPVLACSSAGGGLRLAVVGYERAVTAEAGQRVGLSAGARVVHVAAGPLDAPALAALRGSRPDVLLLVGGTDGGDPEVLLHNAGALARWRRRPPVVLAGNAAARDEAVAALGEVGPVLPTANVLPRIGVLEPLPARAAIREVFVRHVIGGKRLSRGPRFARLVRAATPDAVLAGVEVLADGAGDVPGCGDVLVVDVGGATTDVYSVVAPQEEADVHREVVQVPWRARTVEGDLGVRWGSPGVVDAAVAERLVDPAEEPVLREAARVRAADPGFLPGSDDERALDVRLAELAVVVAVRRHGRPLAGGPRDLRRVRLVLGSGGVLRHGGAAARDRLLGTLLSDSAGGWAVPEDPAVAVDSRYVLAAAGLLAAEERAAAARLLRSALA